MEYGLAHLVLRSSAFIPISEEEYLELAVSKAGLLEALFIEEKFDLLVDNYLELETRLLESTARHTVLRHQGYQWCQVQRSLFNQRLVNLLSACRSYIDHSKQHARALFTGDQHAAERVSREFSDNYDRCLGYRAMEALRSYAQHHGFPVHAVEYGAKWMEDSDNNGVRCGLMPYTKTAYLREDGKFKKSILGELEALGETIDLKPLVRDYVAALERVHELIREMLCRKLESWEEVILSALSRFESTFPTEDSANGLAVVVKDDKKAAQPLSISGTFIDYRRHLQEKNSRLMDLGKRYITSEALEADKG